MRGTINKEGAKIQSGYCMRVLGMKMEEEQKQCKQWAAGEKEGSIIMAVTLEEDTDVKDTPKSSSCFFKSIVMTILGFPKNRQKTHAQQVMEPSVAHQCQKTDKKDAYHREIPLCFCCTMMIMVLTLKIQQCCNEMRVNQASQFQDKCWQESQENFIGHFVGKS
jgi:hypothetical protein